MKTHAIDYYMKVNTDNTYGMSCTMMGIGSIICGISLAFFPLAVFFGFPLALAGLIHFLLMFTCVSKRWSMDEERMKIWEKYAELPESYRKTIGLTGEQMKSFNNTQWYELSSKVNTLNDNLSVLAQYARLPDNVGAGLDALIERDREEVTIRRQVSKELTTPA